MSLVKQVHESTASERTTRLCCWLECHLADASTGDLEMTVMPLGDDSRLQSETADLHREWESAGNITPGISDITLQGV